MQYYIKDLSLASFKAVSAAVINAIPARSGSKLRNQCGMLFLRGLYLYEMQRDTVEKNAHAKYVSEKKREDDRLGLFLQFGCLCQWFGLYNSFQKINQSDLTAEELVESTTESWNPVLRQIAGNTDLSSAEKEELKNNIIADAHMFNTVGEQIVHANPDEASHLTEELFRSIFVSSR